MPRRPGKRMLSVRIEARTLYLVDLAAACARERKTDWIVEAFRLRLLEQSRRPGSEALRAVIDDPPDRPLLRCP